MSDAPSEPYSEGTSEGAYSEGDAPHTTIPGLVVSDIYLQVSLQKKKTNIFNINEIEFISKTV